MKGITISLVVLFVLLGIAGCAPRAVTQGGNDYNLYANIGVYGNNIKNAPKEVIDTGSRKIIIIDLGDGWKLVLPERSFVNDSLYYDGLAPSSIYAAWQRITSQADIEDAKQIVYDEDISALLVKTKRKGGS